VNNLCQYVKPFYAIPERHGRTDGRTDGQTDRQTDTQTDRFAISISRVSVLTRDKNAASAANSFRSGAMRLGSVWSTEGVKISSGELVVYLNKFATALLPRDAMQAQP